MVMGYLLLLYNTFTGVRLDNMLATFFLLSCNFYIYSFNYLVNVQVGPFQVSRPCKFKIKVRVQLNLHGIVVVESAVVSSLIEHCCNIKMKSMSHHQLSVRWLFHV